MTIYNPHLLDRRDLIDTFVARQSLLGELLDDLRRGGGQHHLLVGNRGSGKTTLLLRLAMAIEDDAQLAQKCIPLRFPEEQYNVARLSDFWLNVADALVDAFERQGNDAAARQIEAAVAELEPLDEDDRSKQSLKLLELSARQTRRTIVLLVDNLDLVLDRLAGSHWELREKLSTDNRLVVIGASSKFLEEAIDYQSPFYDFFRVHELEPLSEAEARQVVLALAARAGTPNVAGVLERDPGRFKALFALTGGTPRTLALLHTVLALDQRDSVVRDLDGLLDQLTPYYKARFDDLPALSQVIVDKVALHWHPMAAAECQAATRVEINTVSAQLHRLVKAGVLTKVELPRASKLGFQLSERFFNIWYLMRASRRLRRRLAWFVEFLRTFYGEDELRARAEQLVHEASPGSVNTPAKLLAFATAISDERLRRRLEYQAIALLIRESVLMLREVMDLEGEDVHLAPIIDRVRTLREIRARVVAMMAPCSDGLTASSLAEAVLREPLLPIAGKLLIARALEQGIGTPSEIAKLAERSSAMVSERLLVAISTGEIPSLCDVTTFAEIEQIVQIAESRGPILPLLVFATEHAGTRLSDSLLRRLLDHYPDAASAIAFAATMLVGECDWESVRRLIVAVAEHSSRNTAIAELIMFCKQCIAQELAREANNVLVETGLFERWGPLYEAFRAAMDADTSRFDRLAPEIRAAVRVVYEQLRSHSGVTSAHLEAPRRSASSKRPTPDRPERRGMQRSSMPQARRSKPAETNATEETEGRTSPPVRRPPARRATRAPPRGRGRSKGGR